MGRKVVYRMNHLRRMRAEGPAAWLSRRAVARSYLRARKTWPRCCFRLLQVKQDPKTGQIPDFTLECAYGRKWGIEIGITGTTRVKRLESAGFEVLKVGRGIGFSFANRVGPGRTCPARCQRHLG